eukprot:Opistho-2@75114
MIWQLAQTGVTSTPFGSDPGEVITEHWRCTSTLRAHDGDVCDLAWSADGSRLASGSIDNLVIVWDGKTFAPVVRLHGHSGFVKGVTWDPAGQFLASQSEDLSLRIWRTKDWKLEKTIEAPFAPTYGSPFTGNLFFRRLSWSPDGAMISTAHAYNENESSPVSAVVERDTWETACEFVGHAGPIIATRFNPVLFESPLKATGTSGGVGMCAIGSQDGTLSVWTTASGRAVAVVKDLFTRAVLDLSWDRKGDRLLASSVDGTLALLLFSEDEIGRPISASKTDRLRREAYGVHMGDEARVFVPEDPRYLAPAAPPTSFGGVMSGGASSLSVASAAPLPLLDVASRDAGGLGLVQSGLSLTSAQARAPAATATQQIETRTKDGKRRIQPTFLGDTGNVQVQPVNTAFATDASQSNAALFQRSFSPAHAHTAPVLLPPPLAQPFPPPAAPVTPGGVAAASALAPVTAPTLGEGVAGAPDRMGKRKASVVGDADAPPPQKRPAAIKDGVVPQPMALPAVQVVTGSPESPGISLETAQVNAALYKLTCLSGGAMSWETLLPSRPQRVDGSRTVIAATLEDGSLVTFSAAGCRLLPPVFVGAPCKWLSVADELVLVVGGDDTLHVWEPRRSVCVMRESSLAAVVAQQPPGTGVSFVFLSQPVGVLPSGMCESDCTPRTPVVRLTNDRVYAYKKELMAWVLVGARGCPLTGSSEYSGIPRVPGFASGPLATMQSGLAGDMRVSIGSMRTMHSAQASTTLAHLETQMVAARTVGSPAEWEYWLHTYARRLAEEGHVTRLRELCEGLIGMGAGARELSAYGNAPIARRIQVMRGLLPVIASRAGASIHMQRFVSEFEESLDDFESSL